MLLDTLILAYTINMDTQHWMLWMFVCVMSIPLTQAQIYWAHIIDPPLFRPLTWTDASPAIGNNDMLWSGGAWVPSTTQKENWMQVNQAIPIC